MDGQVLDVLVDPPAEELEADVLAAGVLSVLGVAAGVDVPGSDEPDEGGVELLVVERESFL